MLDFSFCKLTDVNEYPERIEDIMSRCCGLKLGKNVLTDLSKMTKVFKHSEEYIVFPSLTGIPDQMSLIFLSEGLSDVGYTLRHMSRAGVSPNSDCCGDFVVNEIGLTVAKFIKNDGLSCREIETKAPQELWLNTASICLFLAINPRVCIEFGPGVNAISLGEGLQKDDKLPMGYSDGVETFYIVNGISKDKQSFYATIPVKLS